MGGMKFEYDENGAKFVYFALSFYAMIIIPVTYYFWPKKEVKKSQHPEDLSCFEPCRLKTQMLNQDEPKKRTTQKIVKILITVGWIVFLFLAYKASQIEIEHKEYDPFVILGIDRDATDKEIRKQYRELSKTMHPDRGGNEEMFKELTKAYKALTDEEAKNNWKEYGNPDGPGVTQFGIALPKWIVDGKNSYIVLGAYILVFMILMPTFVGIWWYKSIQYTCDQVLLRTFQLYYYLLSKSPIMNSKRIIMILGSSFEFERHSNPEVQERPSDNVEVPQLMKDLPELQEKIREPPFSYPYSVKARALIHAHLSRIDLPPQTLLKDKNLIVKKCPFLINEMVSIIVNIINAVNANYAPKTVHPPKLETLENLMRLSPMIVQALWNKNKKCDLLQLPHLNESHLRHFVTKKRNISTIKQFVTMSDLDRRSVLRHLNDEQYDDIMRVCACYPLVEMDVKIKIIDDEDEHTVTAGALVTLIVNLKRQDLKILFGKEDNDLKSKSTSADYINEEANEESAGGEAGQPLLDGENGGSDVAKQPVAQKQAPKPWEKQKKKDKGKKAKPKQKPKPVNNKPADKATSQNANENNKVQELNNEENSNDDNESGSESDNEQDEAKSAKEIEKVNSSAEVSNNKSGKTNDNDEYFDNFQQMQKKKESLETKAKISHRVFCPYFPDVKQECWWLYVGDRKQNTIITNPIYICTLKDTEEFEVKFLAPKVPGTYTYSVLLRSDSYFDFDIVNFIKFDVNPAKKIEEHPQWDFTDEEEENGDENADEEFATESESDS